jgi:hypothetical protein
MCDILKSKDKKDTLQDLLVVQQMTQVKTAPEFQRTRENMNEFGGCAKAGKSVRVALAEVLTV